MPSDETEVARAVGLGGFEKVVVVKRLLPHLAERPELVGLFLDEARLMAQLHHPNVAQVFDAGVAGAERFFAMESIHGSDLRGVIQAAARARRPLPLSEALTIGAGVCAGLHYALVALAVSGRG